MVTDKTGNGGADRPAAAGKGDEVRYFARKHGIGVADANQLIKRIGNDRSTLNEAAGSLRSA